MPPEFAAKKLLIWAPSRPEWPEPLASWIEFDNLPIQLVTNAYEAATYSHPNSIMLVDLENLRHHDLQQLSLFVSRLQMKIFMLPCDKRLDLAAKHSIEPWPEFCQEIHNHQNPIFEPENPVFDPKNAPAPPENFPPGNSVTDHTADRYDEPSNHPLLSEQEMRALLGAAE